MDTQLAALSQSLLQRHSLPASRAWLHNFLNSTRQPYPPLAALTSTAAFRILNSDISTSIATPASPAPTANIQAELLPQDISDVNIKERHLSQGGSHGIIVQVLDIQDIGSSQMSQLETIERIERGEAVKGREVVRVVPIMDADNNEGNDLGDDDAVPATTVETARGGGGRGSTTNARNSTATPSNPPSSNGPHKLTLVDAAGTKCFAFELVRVPRIAISFNPPNAPGQNIPTSSEESLPIGAKLLFKPGTLVRRGVIMLEPTKTVVLGGKVEAWDRAWREGRKKKLMETLGMNNAGTTGAENENVAGNANGNADAR